jgi:hypothetical protein
MRARTISAVPHLPLSADDRTPDTGRTLAPSGANAPRGFEPGTNNGKLTTKAIGVVGAAMLSMSTASACAMQSGDPTGAEETETVSSALTPSISVGAVNSASGPFVCMHATNWEPGSDIRFTISGMPGANGGFRQNFVQQIKVASDGTALDDFDDFSGPLVNCTGNQFQSSALVTVQGWMQPPPGSVAQHFVTAHQTIPASLWCSGRVLSTYNGGC